MIWSISLLILLTPPQTLSTSKWSQQLSLVAFVLFYSSSFVVRRHQFDLSVYGRTQKWIRVGRSGGNVSKNFWRNGRFHLFIISDVKCRENVNIRKIPRCDWLASGHFRLVDLFIEYLKSCIDHRFHSWLIIHKIINQFRNARLRIKSLREEPKFIGWH